MPSTFAAGALTASALVALSGAAEPESSGSTAAAPLLENLDRGAVSVRSGDGNLVSWRWLAEDADDAAFNVYRDGEQVNVDPITDTTNFLDEGAAAGAEYSVAAVVDGEEQEPQDARPMADGYTDVPIEGGPARRRRLFVHGQRHLGRRPRRGRRPRLRRQVVPDERQGQRAVRCDQTDDPRRLHHGR